jgi:rod shape-determining protein MreD
MVLSLLSLILYQRLRMFNVLQQAGTVFILVGVNQLICQWIYNLQGTGTQSLQFLLPALTSALMWPVVLHVLRVLRRHYRVG